MFTLPDMSGEAVYQNLLESDGAKPPFIFMTGHGAVDQAVRLLKRGAVDYLLKPFEPDLLLGKLNEIASCRLDGEEDPDVLGISPAMRSVEELLARLAQSQTTVLITGESGVGKERVALKLHGLQGIARPFVAANCGAFTETLLEAELFGHEKGAFTGAIRAKRGLFEQAAGGTLFLDEIGDMPLSMQIKVLPAIQERQITRVGGEVAIPVDFRLMAATHQDLKARVEQGVFREDLYYRVNVIQIRVPPLRERREDILWLANRLLEQAAQVGDGRRLVLTPGAERAMLDYPWPGNVRELKHLLERARVLATGSLITPESLFGEAMPVEVPQLQDTLGDYLSGHERDYILRALESPGLADPGDRQPAGHQPQEPVGEDEAAGYPERATLAKPCTRQRFAIQGMASPTRPRPVWSEVGSPFPGLPPLRATSRDGSVDGMFTCHQTE